VGNDAEFTFLSNGFGDGTSEVFAVKDRGPDSCISSARLENSYIVGAKECSPFVTGNVFPLAYQPEHVLALDSRSDDVTDFITTFQGGRSYESSTMTWDQPDVYQGYDADPMSENAYMWNRNNPLDYSDPTGFCGKHKGDETSDVSATQSAGDQKFKLLGTVAIHGKCPNDIQDQDLNCGYDVSCMAPYTDAEDKAVIMRLHPYKTVRNPGYSRQECYDDFHPFADHQDVIQNQSVTGGIYAFSLAGGIYSLTSAGGALAGGTGAVTVGGLVFGGGGVAVGIFGLGDVAAQVTSDCSSTITVPNI
jgi:hypothetical protein